VFALKVMPWAAAQPNFLPKGENAGGENLQESR